MKMAARNPAPIISRRVLKTSWRIAATPQLRDITDVNELMKRTSRLANLCYLNVRQHQQACELAIDNGEAALAVALTHREIHGPFDTD
jgi:hypothetical protein